MTPEQAQWGAAWTTLGRSAPRGLLSELAARYAEPHRAYHTLQHLRECFVQLEPAGDLAEQLAEVQLAVWFHDAIYDTHAHDNEERSARWAREALVETGVGRDTAERVERLVLATKHNATPEGADARLLVDVDLSILGADSARFWEYERQIRDEYSWVPETTFRERRAQVLTSFLERPSIYSTPRFAARLERRARENLSRSLQQLAAASVQPTPPKEPRV
jgi:predicted metal-dependent HD superfamily phosphohydrolase